MTRSFRFPTPAIFVLVAVSLFSATALTFDNTASPADNNQASTALPNPETFLNEAYRALRTKFSIGAPLDSIILSDGEIKAFQRFAVTCPMTPVVGSSCNWCTNAVVSMEVHQSGSDLSVWIAAPHHGVEVCNSPAAYLWYEYVKDADQFLVIAHPLLEAPPFPAPDIPEDQLYRLYNSWRWSHKTTYGNDPSRIDPGADPPHWSSILNGIDDASRGRYMDLHRYMQNSFTQAEAITMLDRAAPAYDVDLTDRAMNLWTPVTLRGLVRSAGISTGDMARDHTTDYHDDTDAPHGDLIHRFLSAQSIDTSWPGQDYDMRVTPDPDVHYLGSWARGIRGIPDTGEPGRFDLNVEIEQFALGLRGPLSLGENSYRPVAGEWTQIIGRWIIDCGHGGYPYVMALANPVYRRLAPREYTVTPLVNDSGYIHAQPTEHYTEIHPPELMVPLTYPTSNMVKARVIATGAWAGEDLTFFVTPPPRPNINATLHYRIAKADGSDGFDDQSGGELEVIPWPATNPNHLVISLHRTDDDWILLYETGMVGMTRRRKIRCIIECWWEIPSASLSGRVTGADALSDTVIYYRNAGIPDSNWSLLPVNSSGGFRLEHLPPGIYWFRPASPNRNFADVPRRVVVREGTNVLEPFAAEERAPSIAEWAGLHADTDLPPDIYSEWTNQLLTYDSNPSVMGVQRNGLRYEENGTLLLHLAGLVKSETDSSAIGSASEAYCDADRGGGPRCIAIDRRLREAHGFPRYLPLGTPGSGVEAATFVVKLLLHINGHTYVADEKTVQTSRGGGLLVRFHSGSHVEDVSIAIEATDNPFNRWFLPRAETSERIKIYPGASGDDSGRQFYPTFDRPVAAVLGLSELLVSPGKLSSLPRKQQLRLKLSSVEAALVHKVLEKRREDIRFTPQFIQSTLQQKKIKTPASSVQAVKNIRLPKPVDDAWRMVREKKFRDRLGEPLSPVNNNSVRPQPTPALRRKKKKSNP